MSVSLIMFAAIASARPVGFSFGPDFDRFRTCISRHSPQIRRPYAPRLGPFEADVRAINRYCGKLRPSAFRAFKLVSERRDPRTYKHLTAREWQRAFDNFVRGILYVPEISRGGR